MRNKYLYPEIKISNFEVEDILTASGYEDDYYTSTFTKSSIDAGAVTSVLDFNDFTVDMKD